jgi:hypothetical protein
MDGSVTIGVTLEDQGFATALKKLQQTAGVTAVSALSNLVQSLGRVSTAFAKSTASGESWSKQLSSLFTKVVSSAASVAPSMQTQGTQAAKRFLSGITSVSGQSAGLSLANTVIRGVSEGSYAAAGSQAAAKIGQGVIAGKSTLSAQGQQLSAAVRSAFSSGWYSVGYNISAGVASGVRGGSSLISQAATTAAKSALAAAKKTLGVHSPSRVFRDQVGKMIPAGIAQGISAGQGQVSQAVAGQAQSLVETARRDVTPVAGRIASGVQQGAVSGSIGGVKVQLEAPLYLDGRELARATAKYTSQQMLWEGL